MGRQGHQKRSSHSEFESLATIAPASQRVERALKVRNVLAALKQALARARSDALRATLRDTAERSVRTEATSATFSLPGHEGLEELNRCIQALLRLVNTMA